ncbi:MAG TPA: IS110 family transposase [Thermomicrobiales bacterium]|nr:IS110 family transposase [Thermomicrobiales bacterium]
MDLHRGQITFDTLDVDSGEMWRGRLWRPDRQRFRRWLREDLSPRAGDGPVAIAVEGCTGWRYVVEEVDAAGFESHVAEPADTQAMRGRKKHAKTDRTDARLLRDLLQSGDLPESWIPPEAVLEWRERCRLYKSLIDQRRVWIQRIHAELYQHGVALPEGEIRSEQTRELLSCGDVELTEAARQRIQVSYRMIDATHEEAQARRDQLHRFGRRQPACRALLDALYGVGPLTAVVVWSELGDCRRFSRSRQVVRHTGLDVTVDASDTRRGGGYLSRQGPGTLRWALFEAGMCAARATSPDRAYYQAVKQRHDGKLAAISMARKLARRCYHILRSMEPDEVYVIPDI